LSNYCVPKDGVLLPRMDSYSSVLPLIVDPFIIRCSNYYGLRRSILIIEAEAGVNWAWVLYLATILRQRIALQIRFGSLCHNAITLGGNE
jgi:hypothetical protein